MKELIESDKSSEEIVNEVSSVTMHDPEPEDVIEVHRGDGSSFEAVALNRPGFDHSHGEYVIKYNPKELDDRGDYNAKWAVWDPKKEIWIDEKDWN